jgi:hypothetical protein
VGARAGRLDGRGSLAAWILRRPARARVDVVTRGRGADDAVNTTTSRLGELSVAEMGEYVGGVGWLSVGPVRCACPGRQCTASGRHVGSISVNHNIG